MMNKKASGVVNGRNSLGMLSFGNLLEIVLRQKQGRILGYPGRMRVGMDMKRANQVSGQEQ